MNPGTFHLEGINPLRNLDQSRVVSLIEYGELGYYARLQWLYRWVEKTHPMVRAVKRRLLASLGSLKWNIKLADTGDDTEKKAIAERQAKTLRTAYDGIPNLTAALKFLALGELRGFSHLEKVYAGAINRQTGAPFDAERDPWDVIELRPVEQWFWARRGFYGPWLYNRTAQEVNTGDQIELKNYVIHSIDDPFDEIAARLAEKHFVNDGDWTGFLYDYGIPAQFLVLPPGVAKEREAEYQRAAELAISAARGSVPHGTGLLSPSATGSGGAGVFSERLKYIDEQIVIAGTSGKLTVIAESGTGTLAGGAQKEAFDEIAQAIANDISGVCQAQFDKPLLNEKHKGEPVLAYFEYAMVDKKDAKGVLSDAKTAADAGFDISEEEISEKSGYKLTRKPAAPPPTNGVEPTTPHPATVPRLTLIGREEAPVEKVASALNVAPEFVAPAKTIIDDLIALAADDKVGLDELTAAAERMLKDLPELAAQSDLGSVIDALQFAMQTAAEATLTGAANA
jgi:hypothetical protein